MAASVRPAAPISLFYSYSSKDKALREQLEIHLSLLKTEGVIRDWHDRRIEAGREWDRIINEKLDRAGIILLLVSADFLASPYCRDIEVTRAMERHEAGTARVIPVILRPCDWQSAPFRKLVALPQDGKPVIKWRPRDEAFADIARGLREVAGSLLTAPNPPTPARPSVPPERPPGAEPSDPADIDVEARRQAYRDRIRSTLEEKLEWIGRDESRAARILDRVASALEIKDARRDEAGLERTLADHLLDVRDIQAIPRLNKLYLDLCAERKEKPADLVADCMDLLFPLYFSWEVIERAGRQLERQKLVLIEGAVSSMPGADFVLAVHDGGPPCFVQHAEGPRGKHAVRVDTPPIGEPSLESDVCQILDHILRQLGVSQDVRGTERLRGDLAARTRRLRADLNGCLDSYKILHGRSLYCVVQKQESDEDRRYWLRVFERLRELVPLLVLIELDPDAPAREAESRLGYCLLVRFQAGRNRSSP